MTRDKAQSWADPSDVPVPDIQLQSRLIGLHSTAGFARRATGRSPAFRAVPTVRRVPDTAGPARKLKGEVMRQEQVSSEQQLPRALRSWTVRSYPSLTASRAHGQVMPG